MEYRQKVVDTGLLLEEYRTLLDTVDRLPLLVTGNSMSPFLIHGRDTVYLTRPSRPLRRGDIVLYRRTNGAYILHRICGVEGDSFSIVGDAQTMVEQGIKRDQIFAVVCAVERKGKHLTPGSFWWDFFEKVWIRMIPLRPVAVKLYGTFRRKRI
ncbi:MAG: S24/S26 family peptidase [Oscillospiraceae bacterium]|nr:S24/S26 family peptidase [Oscillospiraceae bacterium]